MSLKLVVMRRWKCEHDNVVPTAIVASSVAGFLLMEAATDDQASPPTCPTMARTRFPLGSRAESSHLPMFVLVHNMVVSLPDFVWTGNVGEEPVLRCPRGGSRVVGSCSLGGTPQTNSPLRSNSP